MPIEAEWLTRKSRIDARLKQRGWHLIRFSPDLNLKALDKTAVEELPTANGPADYGLFVSGRLLGIVEAKKVTVNPQNVLEQWGCPDLTDSGLGVKNPRSPHENADQQTSS